MTTAQTKTGNPENEARIVPARMAHLVYRCARRAETVAWYLKLFQAQLVFEDNVLTFITYDDEHHRLAFFNMPDIPARQGETAGVHHVAYTYDSIGDLLATYARVKPLGIQPFWCINHGPTTSLYFRDPEGNEIELQADNGDDPGAYFQSEAFAKNPIGVEFDPDELVRMWQAGASDKELSAVGTAATGKSTIM
ncbi:VOC family protein [Caballeronia sp. INDeC2]|uniref:VOC family protein n=1 Tax=Caballeronia sp. INDeC2 TaxID=2921747 RepID=UPI002027CA0B|nr:VOC family protein [Caballeronia sp. INDeC2]